MNHHWLKVQLAIDLCFLYLRIRSLPVGNKSRWPKPWATMGIGRDTWLHTLFTTTHTLFIKM